MKDDRPNLACLLDSAFPLLRDSAVLLGVLPAAVAVLFFAHRLQVIGDLVLIGTLALVIAISTRASMRLSTVIHAWRAPSFLIPDSNRS